MPHNYTPEEREFIKNNIKGRTSNELTQMANEHFGLDLKVTQIRAFMKNNNLKNGLDFRFNPGHVPPNKGKKGMGGWGPTQFKKGQKPHNYMPVGSERVNGDDYVDIKVADPNKWRGKHILVWEKHNGPVPKGHAIIFGDGNRRNFDINNLILVSRGQLATLNRNRMIQNDTDLTKTAVIMVDIMHKISERRKAK
jgi:hypothetical protein